MKQEVFKITKYIAVFAVTLLVLWLLLFLSALIPNEAIQENMEKSALSYKQRDAFEFTNGSRFHSIADHYADSIWLNISWNMGEGSALRSSVQTDYYNDEQLGVNASLYLTVTEGRQPNTDYTRYWHGTAMFIRAGHLFTDVEGVKLIGFAVFLLFTGVTLLTLIRRKHWDLAAILALSLAAVQIWNIRLCMEYQPPFLLAAVFIPVFLKKERRGDNWLEVLSIISGVAVAFFDFLTTETVAILLPLALVLAVRAKENRLGSLKATLLLLLKCGICWLCAYGGAFIVKWIAAGIVTGENAFALAFSSAQVHALGGNMQSIDLENRPEHFFSGLLANLTVLFGGTERLQFGRVAFSMVGCLLLIFSVWYMFRKKERSGEAIPLLILGGLVFVRMFALNNHSYVHEFFVYRALVTPIFALLTAVWLNIELPHKKRRRS